MAKRAFVVEDSQPSLLPNGDMTIDMRVAFWEENGTAVIFASDIMAVSATITSGMNGAQMGDSIVAAVKAAGLAYFGWTMAVNTVVYRAFARG